MGSDATRPNDSGSAPSSPGWHIDTTVEGSGWTKWTAIETTTGKTVSGPAAAVAVVALVVLLLVFGRSEDHTPVVVSRSVDWWVARHTELGIASQGETRAAALENLDEAVALHKGEVGETIETDAEERAVLRDLGIDPDEVLDESKDLPEFMR